MKVPTTAWRITQCSVRISFLSTGAIEWQMFCNAAEERVTKKSLEDHFHVTSCRSNEARFSTDIRESQ